MPSPAWSDAELAANPHAHADKPAKVRAMFAAIAGSYDLNNRLHSFGRDQAWRRFAVRAARVRPGDTVLDIACGTGDLSALFARSHAARVLGADFTHEMLVHARRKQQHLTREAAAKLTYLEADAQNLPLADASVDVVSIAFGIRNVQEPERALAEFARVLRPGGRLVILEFDRPGFAPVRALNTLYTARVMPLTATLVSRDRSGAYRYLPRSVGSFMSREQMIAAIGRAELRNPSARSLTLGVCACYTAVR